MNFAETSEATFGSRALLHPQRAKRAKAEIEQGRLKNIPAVHAHLQYQQPIYRMLTHWHSSWFLGVSRARRLPARDVREEVTTEVTRDLRCNGRTLRRRGSNHRIGWHSKIHSRAVPLGPRSAAKSPDRNGRSGEIRTPDPCSRSKCATRLRYAPPDLAQMGDTGQTLPKKRMIGPERSNSALSSSIQ